MKLGVDVDGTVAQYGGPASYRLGKIGAPMAKLAEVKKAIKAGHDVSWFTTRAGNRIDRAALREWSREHLGHVLPMTQNPAGFNEIWDTKLPGGKLRMQGPEDIVKLKEYRARAENPGHGGEMPFTSQAQRGMAYAAKASPEVRKRHKLSLSDVEKMIAEDQPGKLPKRAQPGMDGILIAIKRKRPAEMERGEVQAMLLDLAKAQIKAIEEKDAGRLAEARQLEHSLLCDLHNPNGGGDYDEEPEEMEG